MQPLSSSSMYVNAAGQRLVLPDMEEEHSLKRQRSTESDSDMPAAKRLKYDPNSMRMIFDLFTFHPESPSPFQVSDLPLDTDPFFKELKEISLSTLRKGLPLPNCHHSFDLDGKVEWKPTFDLDGKVEWKPTRWCGFSVQIPLPKFGCHVDSAATRVLSQADLCGLILSSVSFSQQEQGNIALTNLSCKSGIEILRRKQEFEVLQGFLNALRIHYRRARFCCLHVSNRVITELQGLETKFSENMKSSRSIQEISKELYDDIITIFKGADCVNNNVHNMFKSMPECPQPAHFPGPLINAFPEQYFW